MNNIDKNIRKEESDGIGIENKKKNKCIWCCCALFIFLLVLIIVLSIIYAKYYSSNFTDTDKANNNTQKFYIESEIPDYSISDIEKAQFENNLSSFYNGDELENIKNDLSIMEIKYPEGHFIIVHNTNKDPESFYKWYEMIKNTPLLLDSYSIMIHEMSHSAGMLYCNYLIEDKCIDIDGYASLDQSLFTGDKLIDYVENRYKIDEIYLMEDKQKITLALDEINSYIKSIRYNRAYKQYDDTPSTLARQLYYITLHLKYAKENDVQAWNKLINNKGFSFTLLRLVEIAKEELSITKETNTSGSKRDDNMKLYEDNIQYLNEYIELSGMSKYIDEAKDYQGIKKEGIGITFVEF